MKIEGFEFSCVCCLLKQSSTPKKNVLANGIKGTASPDSARKIDLRLEAKLSAEVSVLPGHLLGGLLYWSFVSYISLL